MGVAGVCGARAQAIRVAPGELRGAYGPPTRSGRAAGPWAQWRSVDLRTGRHHGASRVRRRARRGRVGDAAVGPVPGVGRSAARPSVSPVRGPRDGPNEGRRSAARFRRRASISLPQAGQSRGVGRWRTVVTTRVLGTSSAGPAASARARALHLPPARLPAATGARPVLGRIQGERRVLGGHDTRRAELAGLDPQTAAAGAACPVRVCSRRSPRGGCHVTELGAYGVPGVGSYAASAGLRKGSGRGVRRLGRLFPGTFSSARPQLRQSGSDLAFP
ncbi:hypothetical protein EES45_34875 [Streptomyces sp. ADI97-07]|nr:hypothetical protein EES45_34875 [Streptomyces sp. ADI97-07]